MDDRPVLLSPLLCFVSNYRNEPNLERIVDSCFSGQSRFAAYSLLADLHSELSVENGHADHGVKSSASIPASVLIALFDRVVRTEHAPVFAAEDLSALPITLSAVLCNEDCTGPSNGKASEALVFEELRQIRLCLQQALGQRKGAEAVVDGTEPTPVQVLRSAAKDAQVRAATPPSQPLAINASSPESPLNVRTSKTECRSPSSTESSAASTSIEITITSSNSNSPSEHESPAPHNSTTPESSAAQRRKIEGNRLDRAVRKLTDRLESKSETAADNQPANEPEDLSQPAGNGGRREDAASAPATAPATPTQQLPPTLMHARSFLNMGSFIPAGFPVNPAFNYLEMLKNHLANSSSMANYAFQSPLHHLDRLSSVQAKTDVASPTSQQPVDVDDDDKMSNESSPTPSDASHPRDCHLADDASVGDSADKPFACSQPNCHKRFSNKFLLKKHTFIHTGERPHTCPFCSKRFNRKDNLLRHKKTHITNSVAQFEGRRRHNMLPGVSAEDVATLNALALMRDQTALVVDSNDIEMASDD